MQDICTPTQRIATREIEFAGKLNARHIDTCHSIPCALHYIYAVHIYSKIYLHREFKRARYSWIRNTYIHTQYIHTYAIHTNIRNTYIHKDIPTQRIDRR